MLALQAYTISYAWLIPYSPSSFPRLPCEVGLRQPWPKGCLHPYLGNVFFLEALEAWRRRYRLLHLWLQSMPHVERTGRCNLSLWTDEIKAFFRRTLSFLSAVGDSTHQCLLDKIGHMFPHQEHWTWKFFFIKNYVNVCFASVHVCMPHHVPSALRAQKRASESRETGITDRCELSGWCWDLNLDSQEEQQPLLLTTYGDPKMWAYSTLSESQGVWAYFCSLQVVNNRCGYKRDSGLGCG